MLGFYPSSKYTGNFEKCEGNKVVSFKILVMRFSLYTPFTSLRTFIMRYVEL